MSARLRKHYEEVVRPALMAEFKYANVMQVPRLEKIVINMGVGEAAQDAKKIEGAVADLTAIAGQKPVVTKAKTSIASFKLRENQVVGCKVTLRKDRMYEFLDRFVNIALPRVRSRSELFGKSAVRWTPHGFPVVTSRRSATTAGTASPLKGQL